MRATARVRPGLRAVRKILKPGDTFVVSAIDRAFRSTIEAITFLDEIGADGVSFRSLTQQIDPRTPEGRKWYIDSANSAEYERAVISRRTKEAMAAKMRRGRKFGRPRKMTRKRTAYALEKLAADPSLTVAALAKKMKVSPRTLKRAIARVNHLPNDL